MDTAQWPQEIVVKPIEEIIVGNKASLERRVRPQKEQALNCPRCNSTNTKFCYYNNYSLSQPRYFCKTCRRYWTEGGTLRSIPVGGGSRKNKRSSQSNSSSSSTSPLPNSSKSIKFPDLVHSSQNPKIIHDHDLNLGFPSTSDFKTISDLIQVPNFDGEDNNHNMGSNSATNSSHSLSALELFNGITTSRGFNSFMPVPMADPESVYSSGFSVPEFKPSLGFCLDGIRNSGYGSLQETSGRLLFPFEDLKVQVSSTTTDADQNRENGDSTGYWNGMLGGGSW